MEHTRTLILDQRQIEQKIRRMAYQIYEHNSEETELVIAGIMTSGYKLACKIEALLTEISTIQVELCQIKVDKAHPLSPIECSLESTAYQNRVVILVDDVLNSGATLMYGAKYFLAVPLKKLQTLVLVDRSHKRYPIKVDFKGISLSTSLHETVEVSFEKELKAELY